MASKLVDTHKAARQIHTQSIRLQHLVADDTDLVMIIATHSWLLNGVTEEVERVYELCIVDWVTVAKRICVTRLFPRGGRWEFTD